MKFPGFDLSAADKSVICPLLREVPIYIYNNFEGAVNENK